MKKSNIFLITLFLTAALVLPQDVFAKGGGRGGHYSGGTGSSHKGGHYTNPSTGNHYSRRGSGSSNSSSAVKSLKSSYKYAAPITYHSSVQRDSHGKIVRSESAKKAFLLSLGYKEVPKGYQVDHIIPLYAGGSDTPSNMQLLSIAAHHVKTKSDFEKYDR